jgi:hypothetical protein
MRRSALRAGPSHRRPRYSNDRSQCGTQYWYVTHFVLVRRVRMADDDNDDDSRMDETDAVTLFPGIPLSSGIPKKYSICMLPNNVEGVMEVCRRKIGRSRTFCLVKNCTTNHHGRLFGVKPGDLLVSKVAGRSAFETPRISSKNLDDSVIGEWIAIQDTLTNWTNSFAQANEIDEAGTTMNLQLLELRMDEEKRAVAFKTPRAKGAPFESETTPAGIGISPYTNILSGDEPQTSLTSRPKKR